MTETMTPRQVLRPGIGIGFLTQCQYLVLGAGTHPNGLEKGARNQLDEDARRDR
jgi:hypothetical protein